MDVTYYEATARSYRISSSMDVTTRTKRRADEKRQHYEAAAHEQGAQIVPFVFQLRGLCSEDAIGLLQQLGDYAAQRGRSKERFISMWARRLAVVRATAAAEYFHTTKAGFVAQPAISLAQRFADTGHSPGGRATFSIFDNVRTFGSADR